MAIDNTKVIDAVGIDNGRNAICLLLTDHLTWENDSSLSEYDHLMLLQEKINSYMAYLETRQYEEQYPHKKFAMAVIEIHFKYEITANCDKFLNTVQSQTAQYGIKIEAHIG